MQLAVPRAIQSPESAVKAKTVEDFQMSSEFSKL